MDHFASASEHHSNSSMVYQTMGTKSDYVMYTIICAPYGKDYSSYFSLQVKNKPYEPMGAEHLFLSKVQLRTFTAWDDQ